MLITYGCTVGLFTSVNVLQISIVFHAILVYIYEISYDSYFMQFSFNILSSCIQFISCIREGDLCLCGDSRGLV